jgi:uncharacterized protein DUF1844
MQGAIAVRQSGAGKEMNEEQSNYKVTDRRLFNADGTPREVPEQERPVPEVVREAPAATPETATADPVATEPDDRGAATAATQPPPASAATASATEDDDAELPGADDPAGFASFLMSIASNAAASLGMMEHPATGKREVDLELGKHWIDVLGMLQQKTRGNLLPQEQQILEGLLADLRMQFVSLVNAAPKKRAFSSQDITGG